MTETDRGTTASGPTQIPKRGWYDILMRVKNEIGNDHVSVVSAGVAFFGLLAIFPAIAAIVSFAGFFLDPNDVAAQLDSVVAMLPENAASIIQDQILKVTGGDETATGIAAIFGILLAIYGAMKGMMTLMEGMNIAYDESETRSFLKLYLTGLMLTLLLIAGLIGAIGGMMVLPAIIDFLPVPEWLGTVIAWMKWPVFAVLTMIGLSVLYRYGPAREDAEWAWVTVGSVVATLLWMAGTIAFTIYVQNFGSYNETYGTIGGVIILLTWLWLSSFIVLAGAELNSEIEQQTVRDTTTGPSLPMGQRGAVKADTLPEHADGGLIRPGDRPSPEVSAKSALVSAGLLGLLAAWRKRRRS